VNYNNKIKTTRQNNLLKQLVLVDGQPGCGKTLFTAIVAAMERVELLNFSPELENLCALKYLEKIDDDAVETMIKIQMDLVLYETMMGRRVNIRPRDLSSIFKDVDRSEYLNRVFSYGDEETPKLIEEQNPILHFATHALLGFSEPIFKALLGKVFIVEIVRHPLYMVIQQTLNKINHYSEKGSARQFHLFIKHNGKQLPFWNLDQEDLYIKAKPIDRSIMEMKKFNDITNNFKRKNNSRYGNQIQTIPFEHFVLKPKKYLKDLELNIGSRITDKTKEIILKQNVPRVKVSSGIPLNIYKRCGWEEPVEGLNEKDELAKRRQFAIDEGASNRALEILDKMSSDYENKYGLWF